MGGSQNCFSLQELQIPCQNHFSSKSRKGICLQSPPGSGNHLSVYVWFQGISQFLSFDHKLYLFIPLSHWWHLLHPPSNHTTMGKAICYQMSISHPWYSTQQGLSHAGLHVLLGQEILFLLPWYFCKNRELISWGYRKYIHAYGSMVFMDIYIPQTQKCNQWIPSKERYIKNTIYIGAENKFFFLITDSIYPMPLHTSRSPESLQL